MKLKNTIIFLLNIIITCSISAQTPRIISSIDSLDRKFTEIIRLNDTQQITKLKTELYQLSKSKEEEKVMLALKYVNKLKMSVTEDSLANVIKKRFPKGRLSRNSDVQIIYNIKDPDNKEIEYKKFVKKYPPENYTSKMTYDYIRGNIARTYADIGNPQKAMEYSNQMETKSWKSEGWAGIAPGFINRGDFENAEKLLKMVLARPEWKPVYFDYDALIFLKDIPANQGWIKKHQVDLSAWSPKELDLQELGPAKVIPYRNVQRARALYDMGFLEPAMAEAAAALKVLPAYDRAYKILGDCYAKRGDNQKAFEYFRLACAYDSGNAQYRKDLAMAYLQIGNPEKAVEQAKLSVELDAKNAEAKYILAKAFVKNKQYKEGYDILKQILSVKKEKVEFREKAEALFNEIQLVPGSHDPVEEKGL